MSPALMALAVVAAGLPPTPPVVGVWHNPKNSVAVKTGACGDKLCGWVIRANDQAQADAREGGTPKLIGTALLREYRPSGRRKWSGQIYVPDMGRTFGSTITLVDSNTIDVKGCLIGGFLCKTQTWRRD
jgi:uncharacterized protein (DUF2147 family)